MKKILMILMVVAMVFAMVACGSQGEPASTDDNSTKSKIEAITDNQKGNVKSQDDKEKVKEPAPASQKETAPTADEPTVEEIVSKVIEMQGEPVEKLIEWLGEPQSRDYSSSCLVQGGQDGELVYEGFTVYTIVQADGAETVYDAVAD